MCICNKKVCCKILISAIILIAVVLAVAVSSGKQQVLGYIIFASRFFDVMIPILAVGALLKYLLCHNGCCDCCKCDKK